MIRQKGSVIFIIQSECPAITSKSGVPFWKYLCSSIFLSNRRWERFCCFRLLSKMLIVELSMALPWFPTCLCKCLCAFAGLVSHYRISSVSLSVSKLEKLPTLSSSKTARNGKCCRVWDGNDEITVLCSCSEHDIFFLVHMSNESDNGGVRKMYNAVCKAGRGDRKMC